MTCTRTIIAATMIAATIALIAATFTFMTDGQPASDTYRCMIRSTTIPFTTRLSTIRLYQA